MTLREPFALLARAGGLLVLFLIMTCLGTAEAQRGRPVDLRTSDDLRAEVDKRQALVIGINHYRYLQPLHTAVSDAREVGALLRDRYGFRVTELLEQDATRNGILGELNRLQSTLGENDQLLIYYAGHGYYDERTQKAYWLPQDAERDADTAWIIADRITTRLKRMDAKQVLVVADSCYSGTLAMERAIAPRLGTPAERQRYLRQLLRRSRVLISSGGNEPVTDLGGAGHSVFAQAFITGLRDIKEDVFSAEELFMGYIQQAVAGATPQVPEHHYIRNSGHEGGDFLFWRVARQPAPPSAPTGQTFRDRLKDGLEGPEMVAIAAGSFRIGSPAAEGGRYDDEGPVHEVEVAAFALGRYEVTVGEFRRFVDTTGYLTEAETAGGCHYWDGKQWQLNKDKLWRSPGFRQGDDQPVACVSWNDAVAYVEWLSKETGKGYRLPTEAEWEYAARAGTQTARFWGDDPGEACRYANVADRTWKDTYPALVIHDCTDGYVHTAPVGRFQPNGFGLYDMLGNAWEWSCSAFDEQYAGGEGRCAERGDGGPRVHRGGSWNYGPRDVRSAGRNKGRPADRMNFLGFRPARTP